VDALLTALIEVGHPFRLLMVASGVVVGLIVGVVPGIGGIFGMALLIPLTYHLDPYAAFALLLGMGSVTTTSDTIPAVFFGVPGTVGAAATVLDGHAMAKRGEAARALGAAYSASMIGGVFGALLLAASIPIIRPLILYLKTPDFFAIGVFGVSIVATLAGSQPLKGFAAAGLGALISFIGIDEQSGFDRWTFNEVYFWEGLPIVVVFLGLFGLPELGAFLLRGSVEEKAANPTIAGMWRGVRDTLNEWALVLRCSSIGALLGAVPGVGVAVIDWIAYGHASRRPGDGPRFGAGNIRGVIAPESANNAKEGGSLIPTVAFGVPGSASMALMLGAFVIQGLVPGPDMLGKNAAITIGMVLSIAIANILGTAICLVLTRPLANVARVPALVATPVIITFIVVGAFQNNMSAFDFTILVLLGVIGMAMKELNWPRSAFALGFILGPTLEKYFFLAYQISGWSWLATPLVLIIFAAAGLNLLRQGLQWWRTRREPRLLPAALPDSFFAAVVGIAGAAAFISAIRFPLAAGLFPAIVSAMLTAICAIVVVQAIMRRRRAAANGAADDLPPPGEWMPSTGPIARAYATIVGLCGVLAVAVLALGHLAGSVVFVLVAMLVVRPRRPVMAAIIAAGVALCLYGIFDVLLSQPWPRPWLSELTGIAWR
jgi:TctA family transporter